MTYGIGHHPILSTVAACLILFCALWLGFYLRLRGSYYFMDAQDNLTGPTDPEAWRLLGRTFVPLMERYFDVAKTIIGLSAGSITLMAGFLGYVAKSGANVAAVQEVICVPVFLLSFSILNLIVFLNNLSLNYEEYLVSPKNYTACKYALNYALGFGGLVCFTAGFFWLSASVVLMKAW